MSEHACEVLTAGCFRCDLNRDEMEADRTWVTLSGSATTAARWAPTERWYGMEPAYTPPECDGCVPVSVTHSRAGAAAEIDEYLTAEDEPLWEDA